MWDAWADAQGGGVVEAEIPKRELDYYASRLLGLGADVRVEAPPELSEAIRGKVKELAELYG